jgi:hypothetical protein
MPADKTAWDAFIRDAKNGLFLFYRDYMDYHAHRFCDASLMAYEKGRLIAVLPANLCNGLLYSHQGLTFGGWITHGGVTLDEMCLLFEQLRTYLETRSIKELVYKCIPHIYALQPTGEDIYALELAGALAVYSTVTSAIDLSQPIAFSSRRRRGINKARKLPIIITESADYASFFQMLEILLKEKYDAIPTHTLQELLLLHSRFPQNIRLFLALQDKVLAGAIIYESAHVAHVQYIASNEEGRKCRAVDLLFEKLIIEIYPHKRYFDFGTSHDSLTGKVNASLLKFKEEFGSHPVEVLTYRMIL